MFIILLQELFLDIISMEEAVNTASSAPDIYMAMVSLNMIPAPRTMPARIEMPVREKSSDFSNR